jgi:hypothetical protein
VAWRWTAWRLAISAFVVFHLTATVIWITPASPLKQHVMPAFRCYMIPLGLWQAWSMFAPDPMRQTLLLESEVIDAQGMRHLYEFPSVADLPWWRKMPRFRHPKFAANLLVEEFVRQREFTARHVVRQLGLDSRAFPVHVSLYYQVKEPPPPGTGFADPLTPTRHYSLATYDFASLDEVRP